MEKNLQKKKLKLFRVIKYISLYCLKKKAQGKGKC